MSKTVRGRKTETESERHTETDRDRDNVSEPAANISLWSKTIKNPGVRTCSCVCSHRSLSYLLLTTRFTCALRYAHSLAHFLAPLTHSRALGKVNDSMFQNDLVLSHSGQPPTFQEYQPRILVINLRLDECFVIITNVPHQNAIKLFKYINLGRNPVKRHLLILSCVKTDLNFGVALN